MFVNTCDPDRFSCFLMWLLMCGLIVTIVMLILGALIGWFARGITPDGANATAETLVIVVTGSMRIWSWMFEQGGAVWAFQRLTLLLGLLVFASLVPLILSMATAAIVRDGTEIWPRAKRLVLAYTLIPLVYVLVYHSGLWPSVISEGAMTVYFYRHRACFEQIAAQAEADAPPLCDTWLGGAISGRQWGLGTKGVYVGYWSVGLYRDDLAKGFVYTRVPPEPLVDNLDASPVDNPGYRSYFKHLTGNWYLRYWSE